MAQEEQVARALAASDGFDPEMYIEGPDRLPTDQMMWQHPTYIKYAREALRAVRDSLTPEFAETILQGGSYISWCGQYGRPDAAEEWYGDFEDFKNGWVAAINAEICDGSKK